MELLSPLLQAYSEQYSSFEDALLNRINKETFSNHPHAHMLSGHVQGKFLELISLLMRPRRILEIGTFTGYSAICLAAGLTEEGELHTVELRSEDADTAQKNFNDSSVKDKIHLHVGNALDIIPTIKEQWDIVFIDADKTGYLDYYKLVLPHVRKNGLILADNVLFHGEVLKLPVVGKNAKAIQAFNEYIKNDNTVENVLLTLRDGLMVIVKK